MFLRQSTSIQSYFADWGSRIRHFFHYLHQSVLQLCYRLPARDITQARHVGFEVHHLVRTVGNCPMPGLRRAGRYHGEERRLQGVRRQNRD